MSIYAIKVDIVEKDDTRTEALYVRINSKFEIFIDKNGTMRTNVVRYEIDSETPKIKIK